MVGLTEALTLAQTTRNAFNYWLRAGLLSTTFTETQPGVARVLSRENILEIAFMSAATEIGMPPREASGFVAGWLAKERSGRPQKFHAQRGGKGNWVVLNDDAPVEMVSAILGRKAPGEESSSRVTVFSIIDLEEITRRVDSLVERGAADG